MIARIACATDFSTNSDTAFLHALALSLANRSRLDLMHVKEPGADDSWQSFPHVREVLARWGLVDGAITPGDIEAKVGIRVGKIEIKSSDVAGGISEFLLSHRHDLLVMATHGRRGLSRWLHGSVSESAARRSHSPTLLLGREVRGFVDDTTGAINLKRVLIPITQGAAARASLDFVERLFEPAGIARDNCQLMHVTEADRDHDDAGLDGVSVNYFEGPVVETILETAQDRHVDLIVIPTFGQHSSAEEFFGSTTGRVVADTKCAVLTLPMIGIDARQER